MEVRFIVIGKGKRLEKIKNVEINLGNFTKYFINFSRSFVCSPQNAMVLKKSTLS